VISLYDRHGAAFAAARDTSLFERPWIDRFCALIPSGGTVLDLGCGSGDPMTLALLRRGFAVTGLDASATMVALYRANAPTADCRLADMRDFDLRQRFDAILAWHSLFHLTPSDQVKALARIAAHAMPQAALLFTSGPEPGEALGALGGEALYHASLAEADYRAVLASQGFTVAANGVRDPGCGDATVWLCRRLA
jgi:2-polyprenyl-3-methyl-5-hydroxy-6-metoxy-1,4-benzoquinol methylase